MVKVRAVLNSQKDNSNIEHRVTITDPWGGRATDVLVHFIPSFYTTFQLQTAMSRKFLQVYVLPLARSDLVLSQHRMEILDSHHSPELSLKPVNGEGDVLGQRGLSHC